MLIDGLTEWHPKIRREPDPRQGDLFYRVQMVGGVPGRSAAEPGSLRRTPETVPHVAQREPIQRP
jgi:hypothetical protein